MKRLHRLTSSTFLVLFAMSTLTGCHHEGPGSSSAPTPADVEQLGAAIKSGDTQTVDHLLTAKPDIANSKDADGKSPIQIAGEKADSAMITLIKDHGGHE